MTRTEANQFFQLFNEASHVGVSCTTSGAILLNGYGCGDRFNSGEPRSIYPESTTEGLILLKDGRVAVKQGSPAWIEINTTAALPIGSIVSFCRGIDAETLKKISSPSALNKALVPGVIIARDDKNNPVLMVAYPASKSWNISENPLQNEYELAQLALKRLFGGGIEFEHIITQVVGEVVRPEGKKLNLTTASHAIHHSKKEAAAAIQQNMLRGGASLGLLRLDSSTNNEVFVIFNPDNNGSIKPDNVATPLTEEQKIRVLASGIATMAHEIVGSGQLSSNTKITPSYVGEAIVNYGLVLAEKAVVGKELPIANTANQLKTELIKSLF